MEDGANINIVKKGKKTFSRLALAIFVVAIVTIVIQAIVMVAAQIAAELGAEFVNAGWFLWLANFLPLYLIGIPIGLLVMGKAPDNRPEPAPITGKEFILFMLMCFPLMYGGNIIGNLLSSILSGGTAENPLNDFAYDSSPLKVLFMVILAPVLEEYVFRKKIIDRCAQYGEKTAILFSALCFGLFHMNLFQFFYAFALGLIFAYVYTRTRCLRYSVIMHMVINFLGGVIAPVLSSGVDEEIMEQITAGTIDPQALASVLPSLAGLMLYSFGLLGLSIAGLVILIQRAPRFSYRQTELEIPKGYRFRCVYLNVGFILFFVLCFGMCLISLAA